MTISSDFHCCVGDTLKRDFRKPSFLISKYLWFFCMLIFQLSYFITYFIIRNRWILLRDFIKAIRIISPLTPYVNPKYHFLFLSAKFLSIYLLYEPFYKKLMDFSITLRFLINSSFAFIFPSLYVLLLLCNILLWCFDWRLLHIRNIYKKQQQKLRVLRSTEEVSNLTRLRWDSSYDTTLQSILR